MSIYQGPSIYNFCSGDGFVDEMTLRFMFSDSLYNPQSAGVGTSGTWKKRLNSNYNVWDWQNKNASWESAFENAFANPLNLVEIIDAGNTSNVTSLNKTFDGCKSLTSICLFDTTNVTNFFRLFGYCENLEFVPNFNTENAISVSACFLNCKLLKNGPQLEFSKGNVGTRAQQMFDGCTSLEYVPNYNMGLCQVANYMFRNCSSLKKVPLLVCEDLINATSMFSGCRNVEEGALDFYNYLANKSTAVTTYTGCFTNCGADTETGAAELAQIPSSWGGTGA